LQLSEIAEQSGAFESVWVGDSIIAIPRLEAIALLAAIAARTRRVRLGPACLSSFPLRHPVLLAHQWASLDLISEGRTTLVACMGGGSREAGGHFVKEFATLGVRVAERAGRLEESILVLRRLWSEDHVSFRGRYHQLDDVTIEPKPAQRSLPIWIANNPHLFGGGQSTVSRAISRVARLADGWMTTMVTPAGFHETWTRIQAAIRAEGRDSTPFPNGLYFNVHIDDDASRAYEESKRFLDMYYMTEFSRTDMDLWVAYGNVEHCAERIRQFIRQGVQLVALRVTAWDQKGQLRRIIDDLLPRLGT
jgi:alkanesulfonate monooxygenase SsuD/methylene tetrahydromethanopterin reductase-like flavin-dependent oxidoreductase (luciferase family)